MCINHINKKLGLSNRYIINKIIVSYELITYFLKIRVVYDGDNGGDAYHAGYLVVVVVPGYYLLTQP